MRCEPSVEMNRSYLGLNSLSHYQLLPLLGLVLSCLGSNDEPLCCIAEQEQHDEKCQVDNGKDVAERVCDLCECGLAVVPLLDGIIVLCIQ